MDFYETLPEIQDADSKTALVASFTMKNGIEITLQNCKNEDADHVKFNFTVEQAEKIGQGLIRWAQRYRAENKLAFIVTLARSVN